MTGTNQSDDGKSSIGAKIPTANKTALEDIAWAEDEKEDRVFVSDHVRGSIELFLAVRKATGNIPEDARDDVEHIDADEVLARHGLAVVREGERREVEA
ncbi:hypothetical protein [Halobacterium litoreum]|uniref:Uncharacterized protein n=1 Tax=Halobacterium litoreum TaxID=2039234 RepID=A0ABD5N7Y8_9EURY|nr:hypothetical protein [Halobacterium litoreum]UHH14877.1 hypothetical protein LT972_14820 [Halobacterium litoreum]